MKRILMTAMAATVILLSSCNLDPSTNFSDDVKHTSYQIEGRSNGIVIHDDIILRVITNNASEDINSLELKVGSTVIESYTGCNQDDCTYDLTGVTAGTYEVVAYTNLGRITATITMN